MAQTLSEDAEKINVSDVRSIHRANVALDQVNSLLDYWTDFFSGYDRATEQLYRMRDLLGEALYKGVQR